MTNRGIGWQIIYIGILAGKTLFQQPFKTPFTKFTVIAIQEIPSHLIHNNTDHQLRSDYRCIASLGPYRTNLEQEEDNRNYEFPYHQKI
jgi:hypothetical protein